MWVIAKRYRVSLEGDKNVLKLGNGDVWEGLPQWLSGKESACQCRSCRRCRFNPWVGKIPWRMKWQPASRYLPGKSHGQRSLVGYSPWSCKELNTTEQLSTHTMNMMGPLFTLMEFANLSSECATKGEHTQGT